MKKIFFLFTFLSAFTVLLFDAPASFAAAPVGTFEYYTEIGDFNYTLENGFYYDTEDGPSGKSAIVIYYNGKESKLSIPDTLGGMPVTKIRFFGGQTLDSITEISLPKSIKADETTYSALKSTLPNLTAITVASDNPELTSVGGVLFTKDMSVLAVYPSAKTDISYTEPDTVKKSYGFSYNSFIKEVTFSSNSEYTATSNCSHTNIEKAVIPSNVKEISESTFAFCLSLKEITWGGNETTIGCEAFWNCTSLKGDVVLPKTVKTIEARAFSGCTGITGIKLPFGLTSIKNGAFIFCNSLNSITLPDSVLVVRHAFTGKSDGGNIKIKKAPYLKKIKNKEYTYSAKVKVTNKGKTKQYAAADIIRFKAAKKAVRIKKNEQISLNLVVHIKKGYRKTRIYGDRIKVGKLQKATPDPSILSYSSSNKKVAKVTEKGVVKGIKKGTVKICIMLRTTGEKCYVKVTVK